MADLTAEDLARIEVIGADDPLAGMHAGLTTMMAANIEPFPGIKFEIEDEELRFTRAAIAYAHWVWRTPIEHWHASGEGLVDSEMMRENSAVVKLIRAMLVDGASWREIRKAVLSPKRRLVDGRTAKEALGDWKPDVNRYSMDRAYTYDAYEERYGRTETLWLLAMSHMGFGHNWHGMPEWEELVDCFCIAVDDMGVEFWDLSKEHQRKGGWPLPPRPPMIADTAELRRLLLAGPDLLDAESAEWCMLRSIRYCRRQALVPSTKYDAAGNPLA